MTTRSPCGHCQVEIPPGALICPNCHSVQFGRPHSRPVWLHEPDPLPSSVPCVQPWCASSVPTGATACPACGTPAPGPTAAEANTDGSERVRLILDNGMEIPVGVGRNLIIGRESPNPGVADYLDPSDGVSREHVQLRVSETDVTLTDLRSTNGTWLDGRPVLDSAPIGPGRHELRLGQDVVVWVEIAEWDRR